jgi:hypothetical protein
LLKAPSSNSKRKLVLTHLSSNDLSMTSLSAVSTPQVRNRAFSSTSTQTAASISERKKASITGKGTAVKILFPDGNKVLLER